MSKARRGERGTEESKNEEKWDRDVEETQRDREGMQSGQQTHLYA